MRVGLIIYGSLDTVSGGFLYDRKLVDYLRRQGVSVEIISLPWATYGRSLLHNLSPAILRQLTAANVDLLLQDELNHPSLAWLNGRYRRTRSTPIISIVHHLRVQEQRPAWQRLLYCTVERRYLRTVDAFIYNSETTRATVHDLIGATRHVVATPAGDRFQSAVDDAAIAARARAAGPLRLLFVGNLIPRKGLHTLLDALAWLKDEPWTLDVVGDTAVSPRYTTRIQNQIATAGLHDQVTLHGALSDDALAARFARSHLLAVPSTYEGFGIVYLEAMAFGLPAIATHSGAAHELITHGENGFLVPPQAAADLVTLIGTLLHDRDGLIRLSRAALSRARAHPTWDDSMARVHTFLQRVAGGG